MFDQKQIAEFKEAFSMIDHDSDGFIDKEDLKDMLASLGTWFSQLSSLSILWGSFPWNSTNSIICLNFPNATEFTVTKLGQNPSDEYIDDMINEAPGSINFTMFLTLMGEKLSGTDPEHEILQAFEELDPKKTGFVNGDSLRELMTSMGDRFTDEEVFWTNKQMSQEWIGKKE